MWSICWIVEMGTSRSIIMRRNFPGKKTVSEKLLAKKQRALYEAIIVQGRLEEADVETPGRCCKSKKEMA